MRASPWVRGRNLANQVRKSGRALIGNSEPARNQGTIAIAGTRAMYSSCLGYPAGQDLGGAVHPDGERDRGGHKPAHPGGAGTEMDAPGHGDGDEGHQLQGGHPERHDEVSEHEQPARDWRGEEFALRPVLPVHDDAETGEHRVELCLDQLRSTRSQRETYVGPWLPEPLIQPPGGEFDRAERVTLDDSVRMALLVVLE